MEARVGLFVTEEVVVTAGTPEDTDAAGSEVAVAELGEIGSTLAPTLDNPEGLASGLEDAVVLGKLETAADAEVTAPAASNGAAVDRFVTRSNNVLTEPSPLVTESELAVNALDGLAGSADETVEVFAGEIGSAVGTGAPDAVPDVVTAEADPAAADKIDADGGFVSSGAIVVVVDGVPVTGCEGLTEPDDVVVLGTEATGTGVDSDATSTKEVAAAGIDVAITLVGTTEARVPVTDELVATLGCVVVVVTGADVVTGTEVVVVATDTAGAGLDVTGVDVVEVVEGVDGVDEGVAEGDWPVRVEAAVAIDLIAVAGTNVVAGVDDVLVLGAETMGTWADCDAPVTTDVTAAGIDAVDIRVCVVDVGELEDSADVTVDNFVGGVVDVTGADVVAGAEVGVVGVDVVGVDVVGVDVVGVDVVGVDVVGVDVVGVDVVGVDVVGVDVVGVDVVGVDVDVVVVTAADVVTGTDVVEDGIDNPVTAADVSVETGAKTGGTVIETAAGTV